MDTETLPPVEVPFASLSPEAQRGVIDAFIGREGTDYGAEEASHTQKLTDLRRQIEQGKIKLVYDPNSESITLLTEQEWRSSFRLSSSD